MGPRAGHGVRNHVGLKRIKLDRGRESMWNTGNVKCVGPAQGRAEL